MAFPKMELYSEWIAVRKQHLCLIPEGVDDATAAGIPVAYLTAQMALSLASFSGRQNLCSRRHLEGRSVTR